MNEDPDSPDPAYVVPLDEGTTVAQVGGKGASLARLAAARLPIPPGFHVTTAAYRAFVAQDARQGQILAAVAGLRADDPVACDEAADKIARLFAEGVVPEPISDAVRQAYAGLGSGSVPVAVRSSATAEDLPEMSFAGQQDTYLNIHGEREVLAAVRRCWASLWTARAIGYRLRNGIPAEDVALAVVVQELVPADAAGVLFTADPMTGATDQVLVNATWGLGEALVGGQVTPDTILVDRATGAVTERRLGDKAVMTVRTSDGTREVPVPAERRSAPVLTDAEAGELARLGVRVERLYDRPMDIEWARHDGTVFIVQARPVTALRTPEPATEEWNDTRHGDYLWTSANLGEAIPDVMTPATWSLIEIFMAETMALAEVGGHRLSGNIAGRFYLNLSVSAAAAGAFGLTRLFLSSVPQVFGRIPDSVTIPPLPMSRWELIRATIPPAVAFRWRLLPYQRNLDSLVAEAPARFDRLTARVGVATTPSELADLWRDALEPYLRDASRMLAAGARSDNNAQVRIQAKVRALASEADTNALLTGLQGSDAQLASLGPLVGLAQLRRGEIDRECYARSWGHRGPHEFEVSIPRPAEDPYWTDRQLAEMKQAKVDANDLLARQESARKAAWERLGRTHPRAVRSLRRRIDRAAHAARAREAGRSEVIRAFWAMRIFILRAGELTGHGDDLFLCTIQEIQRVLAGDETPLARIPIRRRTYEHYRSLPVTPTLIRGTIDPERWAADPNRRGDVHDATAEHPPMRDTVTGFPGASGVVEGLVRVVSTPDQGDELRAGEILVTAVTNIGWTPLFPRAAAVVTDVGAPLSHAAIVARELGIPAVVGCGNATLRLHTGDRVRVDGERGTVDVLEPTAG